jgi:hypothetical protein
MEEDTIEEIKKKHGELELKIKAYELERRNEFLKNNVGKWFYDVDYTDVFYKILPADKFQDCRVFRMIYNRYQDYDISIIHSIDILSMGEVASGSFQRKEIVKGFEEFWAMVGNEIK